MRGRRMRERWMMIGGLTAVLMAPLTSFAAEVTSGGTGSAKPNVIEVAGEVFQQVGAPTDFTVQGLISYAIYFIVIFGLAYCGKRWSDWGVFTDALDVVADRVYLEKIEGDEDGKLSSRELREAGWEMVKGMGGAAGKLALRYGPEYVMAKLHDRANKKKQAGAKAKADLAIAERAAAATARDVKIGPTTSSED